MIVLPLPDWRWRIWDIEVLGERVMEKVMLTPFCLCACDYNLILWTKAVTCTRVCVCVCMVTTHISIIPTQLVVHTHTHTHTHTRPGQTTPTAAPCSTCWTTPTIEPYTSQYTWQGSNAYKAGCLTLFSVFLYFSFKLKQGLVSSATTLGQQDI